MNEENFANAVEKSLKAVLKLSELLMIGPSEVERVGYAIFVKWLIGGLKNSVMLSFASTVDEKGKPAFGLTPHVADQLDDSARAAVDKAINTLLDYAAVKEQTAQL